jgi:hypothetical protein
MSMILECKEAADFVPHPEGIHPAVCVDVIDLGMVETEFQGQKRIVPKLKLVFESEQKTEDGRSCVVSRRFTASLHPKARLAEFLGKWRGRPVVPGESIDLSKLIGACCTLVVSHQQNPQGRTFASIDAISKPTKKLKASGGYDPAAARQRAAEYAAKQSGAPQRAMQPAPTPQPSGGGTRPPKSGAPVAAAAPEFDPEVGF